jgi:beta-alanine--pyruvate transaminase
MIGRERGYHGVGFGGMSVGGIGGNRKTFSTALLPGVDHLPHTHNLEKNAFTKGEPEYGAHLADELERIVALHDASNIAAVIVEPVAGSTGVLMPPKGYLKRLREICTKHGILLIFDEVITGFGRLGALRRRLLRRRTRHLHHRQGPHQRRGADGRGVRQAASTTPS